MAANDDSRVAAFAGSKTPDTGVQTGAPGDEAASQRPESAAHPHGR